MQTQQNEPTVYVEFYMTAKLDVKETKRSGREIYKDVPMVRIRSPMDMRTDLHAPAHSYSQKRMTNNGPVAYTYADLYPEQYDHFMKTRENLRVGTPLTVAPFISPAKAKELEAYGIVTIESLAALDGGPLSRLGMGARGLKDQAAQYLADASRLADVNERSELQGRIAELEEKLAAMVANQQAPTPAQEAPSPAATGNSESDDPFQQLSDDELKQAIRAYGGSVPPGRASRETLLAAARKAHESATSIVSDVDTLLGGATAEGPPIE